MSENQKQSVEGWSEKYLHQTLKELGATEAEAKFLEDNFLNAPEERGFSETLANFREYVSQQQLEVVEMIKKIIESKKIEIEVKKPKKGRPYKYPRATRTTTSCWLPEGVNGILDDLLQSLSTLNINK